MALSYAVDVVSTIYCIPAKGIKIAVSYIDQQILLFCLHKKKKQFSTMFALK